MPTFAGPTLSSCLPDRLIMRMHQASATGGGDRLESVKNLRMVNDCDVVAVGVMSRLHEELEAEGSGCRNLRDFLKYRRHSPVIEVNDCFLFGEFPVLQETVERVRHGICVRHVDKERN